MRSATVTGDCSGADECLQSRTTEGAKFNSAPVKRCRRIVDNPTTIAKADQARAAGTPWREASSPHTALPTAIPPCSTSKYIERARARIQEGHMVWATTLKQAKMPIQAAPAVNNTRQSH